jgi:hypothetical protein
VAQEIVQTLVGSLGLIAAVPITTWLACVLVTRTVTGTAAGPNQAAGPNEGDGPAGVRA